MPADDLDSTLDRLLGAADAVGANLLELERDPSYELLQHIRSRGETLRRWQAAEASLARLWEHFGALRAVLDEARAARSQHTRRELLTGPSVRVSAPDVPLRDRDLLEPASHVEELTPDDAIAVMRQEFDAVRLVVGAVGLTWDVALPHLRSAEATLDRLASTAAGLGADMGAPVRLREEIAGLTEALMADPLSVSPDAVAAVSQRVIDTEAEILRAVAARDGLTDALAQAHELGRRLVDVAALAHATYTEVQSKIAALDTAAPGDGDALVAELADIDDLVAGDRWMEADGRLSTWTSRASSRLDELQSATEEIRRPLLQRNELRGRLDAYRAKVGRVGHSEDPRLDAIYRAAKDELYTAPTDLTRATQLVTDYAEAMPAQRPRKAAGR